MRKEGINSAKYSTVRWEAPYEETSFQICAFCNRPVYPELKRTFKEKVLVFVELSNS